LNTSLEFLPI